MITSLESVLSGRWIRSRWGTWIPSPVGCIFRYLFRQPYEVVYIHLYENSHRSDHFQHQYKRLVVSKDLAGVLHCGYTSGFNPGAMCNKPLVKGDMMYKCPSCMVDSTVVLCRECFSASIHTHHAFKAEEVTGPGGFCDCGDLEAFTRYPTCKTHLVGIGQQVFI